MAVTASAVAHLVVLAIAFAQHPTIPIPDRPETPAPDAITVQLVRRPPSPSRPPAPLRPHRMPATETATSLPVAPRPAPTVDQPASFAPATPSPVAGAGPDLRRGLRQGAAGCANLAAIGMTRAQRDLCNERLGRNLSGEAFLPAAIPRRIRAYYDAVAEAKAPDPSPVRLTAQGAGPAGVAGLFAGDERTTNGHGPGIGCKWPAPKLPHALMFGPCYIEPPKGSLTPEVDITPP